MEERGKESTEGPEPDARSKRYPALPCLAPTRLLPDSMDTLSRREEDALIKSTKEKALKECDSIVKGSFPSFRRYPGAHYMNRIRRLCGRSYDFGRMGMQGQVQGRTRMHAAIVR